MEAALSCQNPGVGPIGLNLGERDPKIATKRCLRRRHALTPVMACAPTDSRSDSLASTCWPVFAASAGHGALTRVCLFLRPANPHRPC
jgi:hypothetical protein